MISSSKQPVMSNSPRKITSKLQKTPSEPEKELIGGSVPREAKLKLKKKAKALGFKSTLGLPALHYFVQG
ncbi:MAG: hypothetical protein NVV63_12735 [Opitutus sp.]|nr:hypothetical protein [Opitutus sp.]